MAVPKRFGSNPNKPAFGAWKDQEARLARTIGGRLTSRSGAGDEKGDARNGIVTVEAKSTGNKSFSVTLDMIEKLENAALNRGEMPVLMIMFVDKNGKKLKEVAVAPAYVLQSLATVS